ncbi:MAG: GatB/YqeY domain-containing protein [Nitrospirae bacterium]|nr:GatB/YqeY domain-containing protein [Nitrospirota bacterium]
MPLSEKIASDYKDALKSGDKDKVSILRMIKAAIKNREIDKGGPLDDDEISGILRTFVKRANESIEQFSKAGRTDIADKERSELVIIQDYLPKQLGEDEIKTIVKDAIAETGAAGAKDMGKVMKAVMAKTKGQADGKLVNNLVKELLGA